MRQIGPKPGQPHSHYGVDINLRRIDTMKAEIKGGNLILTLPLSESPAPSKSGKTLVVASTRGNQETQVQVKGKNIVVGVNAYIYAD
jgi:hypothetical protein